MGEPEIKSSDHLGSDHAKTAVSLQGTFFLYYLKLLFMCRHYFSENGNKFVQIIDEYVNDKNIHKHMCIDNYYIH